MKKNNCWQVGPNSGLKRETLLRYRKREDLLERCSHGEYNGQVVYFHSENCGGGCEYSCNGEHGVRIVDDIDLIEKSWGLFAKKKEQAEGVPCEVDFKCNICPVDKMEAEIKNLNFKCPEGELIYHRAYIALLAKARRFEESMLVCGVDVGMKEGSDV